MVECVYVWLLQTDNHQTHYNFIFTLNITFTVTLFMLFGSISSITSGGDQTNSTLYLTKSCVYVLFFFSPGGPTVYYVQNCVSKFMNQKRFVNWLRYTTHNKRNVTQQRETKKISVEQVNFTITSSLARNILPNVNSANLNANSLSFMGSSFSSLPFFSCVLHFVH